jgi:hypothetical protein
MDNRIEYIFNKEMKGDKSFQEKPSGLATLFGYGTTYKQTEVRDIWHRGIKVGIEIGLNYASPQGQIIQLNENTDPKHREFLEKFYKLAEEYKCAIEYHPEKGMIVLDRDYESYMR